MYRMRPRLRHTRGPDSPLEEPGVSKSLLEGGVGGCSPIRPLSAWEEQGVGSQTRRMMYMGEHHGKVGKTEHFAR